MDEYRENPLIQRSGPRFFEQYGLSFLRIGMSLVFFYFGYKQVSSPENWVGFLPDAITTAMSTPEAFVIANGVFELIFGAMLLLGIFTLMSALLLGLHLVGITLEIGLTNTGVRDFGLAVATLAIAMLGPDRLCLEHKYPKLSGRGTTTLTKVLVAGALLLLAGGYGFVTAPETTSDTQTIIPENTGVLDQATVATHATADDCWIIVNDNVYDVTEYIPFHPGGQNDIINECGTDATIAFETQGGEGSHSQNAQNQLAQYLVGSLGEVLEEAEQPSEETQDTLQDQPAEEDPVAEEPATIQLTMEELALHNTASDCWLLIDGKIYDVTEYIPFHPGGQNDIINECGTDATVAFNTQGGEGSHSQGAHNKLSEYLLGDLDSTIQSEETTPTEEPTVNSPSIYEQAIEEQFPGATITDMNIEDNGSAEVEIIHEGEEYTIDINPQGVITSVDD